MSVLRARLAARRRARRPSLRVRCGARGERSAVELLTRSDLGGEAFRLGERAWGLQFHPEAEESILDGWYARPEVLEQAAITERQGRAADGQAGRSVWRSPAGPAMNGAVA